MGGLEPRFWRRVRIGDGCWLWDGPPGSHGYGQAWTGNKVTTAPRLAFELWHKRRPVNQVNHTCDNKMCVRPDHLYDGTHIQNMDDMARAGRHPNRKLTSEQAAEIRSSRRPQRALAAEHGVSQRAVWMIKQGRTYRHDRGSGS